MLSLTILAMAAAVTSALPRGELAEEGNLYSGLYRDQPLDDKDGRNLDTVDTLQNNKWNLARIKRNLSPEFQKSSWSKRNSVSVQPNFRHRYYKKEGGTLDSLGGGHLIRNLQGNEDSYEHEIKKEALKSDYRLDPSKVVEPAKYLNHIKLKSKNNSRDKHWKSFDYMRDDGNVDDFPLLSVDSMSERQPTRDVLDSLGGGHLLRNVDSLGGGHLTRGVIDSLGGGHLLRNVDSLGGSHLTRDVLDSLGGGHLLRNVDSLGGGHLTRDVLDSLGGGHLLRNVDSLGGGHLTRDVLDSLGGGHLLRNVDSLGGGHLTRDVLDSLGGGHLLRNVDSLGGGHLTRDVLDSLGGGHLVRNTENSSDDFLQNLIDPPGDDFPKGDALNVGREHFQNKIRLGKNTNFFDYHHMVRDKVDSLGGGHLLRDLPHSLRNSHLRKWDFSENQGNNENFNFNGIMNRDVLDSLGGGHLVRDVLDSLGGGHLVRDTTDPSESGHLTRDVLDSLGGGHLIRDADPRTELKKL